MDDSALTPLRSRFSTIESILESTIKVGAAIGVLALGSAFLYDFVFWFNVDRRVLSYFVIADHIQTAVAISAILLSITALIVAGTVIINGVIIAMVVSVGHRKMIAGLLAIVLVVVTFQVAHYWLDERPSAYTLAKELLLGCALGWVVASNIDLFRRPLLVARLRFFPSPASLVFISLFLVMVIYFVATNQAKELGRQTGHDVIEVEVATNPNWGFQIQGKFVRSMDRGAILKNAQSGSLIFIPKERIRRIELDPIGSDFTWIVRE